MQILIVGGSFWGQEFCLRNVPGITTRVGYARHSSIKRKKDDLGNDEPDPNYYNAGHLGYQEAVEVTFQDGSVLPKVISLSAKQLIDDPTPSHRLRYQRAIVCFNQENVGPITFALEKMKIELPVNTDFVFFEAEPFHQKKYERDGYGDE